MDLDLNTVDSLLTTTRAVRRRLDLIRPVPVSVVMECLALATQAPNAGNAQNWRWLVVTDPVKRAAIGDLYRRNSEEMYKTLAANSTGDLKRLADSAVYLVDHLSEVPVLVIPCVRKQQAAVGVEIPLMILLGSIYPAIWSFQLALRSRGLGSSLTNLFADEEISALLGIPSDVIQAGLIPVGYFTGTEFKPAPRLPVEDVTFVDRWGVHADGSVDD